MADRAVSVSRARNSKLRVWIELRWAKRFCNHLFNMFLILNIMLSNAAAETKALFCRLWCCLRPGLIKSAVESRYCITRLSVYIPMFDVRFTQRCLWRLLPCGLWTRVVRSQSSAFAEIQLPSSVSNYVPVKQTAERLQYKELLHWHLWVSQTSRILLLGFCWLVLRPEHGGYIPFRRRDFSEL